MVARSPDGYWSGQVLPKELLARMVPDNPFAELSTKAVPVVTSKCTRMDVVESVEKRVEGTKSPEYRSELEIRTSSRYPPKPSLVAYPVDPRRTSVGSPMDAVFPTALATAFPST